MRRYAILLAVVAVIVLVAGRQALRADQPRVLSVGPGKAYAVPSAAAAVAKDGDIIEIAAGAYPGDVARWTANHLTIRGVGGRAVLDAGGKAYGGKAIWVIAGDDTTVEHIEFTGCRVPDKNGAGIRQEGAGLTVRDCFFHDNEDGILTGANAKSDIVLDGCEFKGNGFGDGFSHNLYIGRVRSFTMKGCYSHHARIGHIVKSRAENNYLLYNRLMDEADGTSSYVVDLPNGGRSILIGNVIQQGPKAENSIAVSYAAEGAANPVQELYVVNNTFVNERSQGKFLRAAGDPVVKLINNLFTGTQTILIGNGDLIGNYITDKPGFVDPASYDYHLTLASPAINRAIDPGKAGDYALKAVLQYKHPLATEIRKTAKDAGAFESESAR